MATWNKEVMDTLGKQYRESHGDDFGPGDPNLTAKIERQIILLTEGVTEHPEGWEYPCYCDECRSNG